MNKTLGIGIVVIVVLVAGIAIYSLSNSVKNKAAIMEKEQIEKAAMGKDNGAGGPMMKDEQGMMKTGLYVAYAPDKIAMASENHDVVLFFRASWCPTCKAIDADIRSHLKEIPESLTILDVDYDNSAELKKKYGVTYQHTFVQVDATGNLIKKWTGSPTLAALVSEIK